MATGGALGAAALGPGGVLGVATAAPQAAQLVRPGSSGEWQLAQLVMP
jgi:hypothetical protein